MNRKSRAVFWTFTALTAALTAFIFYNSLQTGEESSEMSNFVTDFVSNVLGFFGISLDQQGLSHFIRKLAHFSEYCALGFTSSLALSVFKKRFFMAISPIYCIIIALCDEFIMQAITAGRGPAITDIFIDSAGAFTALVFVSLALLATKRKENKNEK